MKDKKYFFFTLFLTGAAILITLISSAEAGKQRPLQSVIKDVKVDINNAQIEDLMRIPGIGEKKARDIIDYREKEGIFMSVEEIMNIKGIKKTTFEKIKEHIYVSE
ncbi:MAG: ComEA family DNA-binding protein [bacterium]